MITMERHARGFPPDASGFEAQLKAGTADILREIVQPILDAVVLDIDRGGVLDLDTSGEIYLHLPIGNIDDTPIWRASLAALVDGAVEGFSTVDGRLVDLADARQLHSTLLRITERLGAQIASVEENVT